MTNSGEQSSNSTLWTDGIVVIGCRFNTLEFVERARFDKIPISGIVTIGRDLAERNAVPAWVDLQTVFRNEIPVYVAKSYDLSAPEDEAVLIACSATAGICVGWQRLLPSWFLDTCRLGVFGMHACQHLLPQGRGRSPINWGLIEGAQSLHAHTFRYKAEADAGKILNITEFPVEPHDDVHTLQQKCRVVLNAVVRKHFDDFLAGDVSLSEENPDIPVRIYGKRSPEDGQLDWSWPVRRIVDFVRAQTRPYPGAFVVRDGKEFRLWVCTSFPMLDEQPSPPGTIVERFLDDSLVVAAGDGNIHVREHDLPPNLTYGDRL